MLISEVRERISKYDKDELRLLVSEMYKAMPKSMREEKNIDEMLQDIKAYLSIGKVQNKKNSIDINTLSGEILTFIDHAYKQYYFAPNNVVHKKERPKWRFKVKSYVKDLQEIPVSDEAGAIAADLLGKLYEMLCYGCAYYIFSTVDPFRSVGIAQTELLDSVISRRLASGADKDCLKSVIELVVNSRLDSGTLHESLQRVLIKNLKSTDFKELAIEQCMAVKADLEKSKLSQRKKQRDYDYILTDKFNNLAEMVFRLNASLCQYEEAISYFKKNYVDRDEVLLYKLLDLLIECELKDYWIREYNDALKRGVKPRESLRNTYAYIKDNGILPDYIL